MTTVEIILIVIGIILMIGSFFVTEKLSQQEVEQISQLSSNEMKFILEKNMKNTEKKVEELVDDVIDRSMEIADRALDKETNMKIQEISEYAETVLESIHKNHNEVMFLYSMLNEKQTDLTETASRLEKMRGELNNLEEEVGETVMNSQQMLKQLSDQIAAVKISAPQLNPQAVSPQMQISKAESQDADVAEGKLDFDLEADLLEQKEAETLANNNQSILSLHQQGMDIRQIAKQLGLGVGEVKLVIDLYREEEA